MSEANSDSNTGALSLKDLVITSTTEPFVPEIDGGGIPFSSNDFVPAAAATTLASPAIPAPSSIPVTVTKSFRITASKNVVIPTDCFVQLFGDRVFIGISQRQGKIGNYLLCQADPSQVKPKSYDYEIVNLLGERENPLLSVFARRIAEVIVQTFPPMEPLTLVLGISLLNGDSVEATAAQSPPVFRSIIGVVGNLYVEAVNKANR